ncbi:MAG: GGDEF domain-containing protein [Spirochaetales bacterium]|nr:GGDEF domain-containing protein [Spirochaetales bacterium]
MKQKNDHVHEHERLVGEILQHCLDIDTAALHIYRDFSSLPLVDDVLAFFKQLQHEEATHVSYWRQLLKLSKEGFVMQLFEDPRLTLLELKHVLRTTEKIQTDVKRHRYRTTEEMFYAMLRVEYSFLFPPFVELFRFAEFVPDHMSMEKEYDDHIQHIVNMLKIKSYHNPMLMLSGEYIQRLWKITRESNNKGVFDMLTGVFTRQGFYQHLRPLSFLSMRRELTVAIMMIDVDFFKKINDSLGHPAGDAAIRYVAEYILQNIRKSDILGRFGGDEFIVFFSDVQADALLDMAEKIRAGIAAQKTGFGKLTVSIGIALDVMTDEPEKLVERLLKEADTALYDAKNNGRNCAKLFKRE